MATPDKICWVQTIIQQNRLEAFYPPQALQQVMQQIQRVDLAAMAAQYRMPMEVRIAGVLLCMLGSLACGCSQRAGCTSRARWLLPAALLHCRLHAPGQHKAAEQLSTCC